MRMARKANRLRTWRRSQGLSTLDVAKRLGVSYQTVHRWEVSDHMPKDSRLASIAMLLNVPLPRLVVELERHYSGRLAARRAGQRGGG